MTIALFMVSCTDTGEVADIQEQDLAHPGLAAIEAQLSDILERIPVGWEYKYGFKNREEFAVARLGDTPIQLYVLPEDRWTGLYRVPVIVGDEFRALITYDESGEFKVLSGAELAKQFGSVFERFEKDGKKLKHARLVRSYDTRSDYYQLNPSSKDSLEGPMFPLNSGLSFLERATGLQESQRLLKAGITKEDLTAFKAQVAAKQ